MKYKILPNIDFNIWNNNLLLCEYSTFFQTAEFLSKNNSSRFPIFIYVYDDMDNVLGQLGVIISKSQSGYSSRVLKKLTKTASKLGGRGSWIGGPIIHSKNKSIRKEVLQTFFLALNEVSEKYDLMILDGYSPPQDFDVDKIYLNEFEKNNFKKENFLTLTSNLNEDLESIWKKIKKSARNDVTKAEREKIKIIEISTKDELIDYKSLTKKWAHTKGIEITNTEKIDTDWLYLKSGIQKFFLASKDEKILAGLRIGCFNRIAYTHQVLNSYSKIGNVAGPLLTWYAIKWAKKNNMKIYDFSGGEAPPVDSQQLNKYNQQWKSLFEYKRKWSGNEFPYYHFVKIINSKSYKLFRMMSLPDMMYRNYKKKHFKKPSKNSERK